MVVRGNDHDLSRQEIVVAPQRAFQLIRLRPPDKTEVIRQDHRVLAAILQIERANVHRIVNGLASAFGVAVAPAEHARAEGRRNRDSCKTCFHGYEPQS
jgi:hypothetical protein